MSSNKLTLLQNYVTDIVASAQSVIKFAAMICRSLMLAALALLCTWNPSVAEESSERKSQIIAAYLFHFTKFTGWPTVTPVFHYCVYEDADFTGLMKKAYSDKTVGEASIDIKNINAQSKWDDCQLIYFSQAAQKEFVEKISKYAILSVGAQNDFIQLDGIIYLFEEEQKIRFYINNVAATNAGLKISSQLLQLSKEP